MSVHADGETGIGALVPALMALGGTLTTAQGRDPKANGLAEQAASELTQMSQAVLATHSPEKAAALASRRGVGRPS